ncbi:alpha/beta hydrolase fold domain-containing protein [Microbacterium terrisoli]|uniref:alpha/beta hydrolase fold domain-containing protein n=1 Tax=Microbacterium terrisoli TaxID=3242192 RepID=UPI0028044063|nr:alpha/beta hydrolase fold domain-containing protein [Microbacterium protaetiae]
MLTPADVAMWFVARRLGRTGTAPDPRPDIDTASLQRRFPRLATVVAADVPVASDDGPVPARLYRDHATLARNALVWVHGGAWLGGDLDMPESNWVALELAAAGIPTLAVDYRKALRGVRHPAPLDDVQAAWRHATAHTVDLFGTDATRVHLGGASAGGALAAGVVLRARDAAAHHSPGSTGDGRVPASLVLAYPMLYPRLPPNSPETKRLMAKMPARLRFRPSIVRALAKHYAGAAGMTDPTAFPGFASDLRGFPPTYVLVAAIDDLRSSGDMFGERLRAAGVRVELFAERSATHGHLNHPEANSAQRSVKRIVEWIDGFA